MGFQNTDTRELVIAVGHLPTCPWFPLLPEASNRDEDLISERVGRHAQGQAGLVFCLTPTCSPRASLHLNAGLNSLLYL